MQLDNKKIMVIGLGKSGFALLEFLDNNRIPVKAFDSKDNYDKKKFEKFSNIIEFNLGKNPTGNEEVDLIVISPGIPQTLEFIQKFKQRGIQIVGEVEFAFWFAKGNFVGITGTNGKTTTTTLVGEIFKLAEFDTRVVGNIGNPIISEVSSSTENTVFVSELSSFQLETLEKFKCHSSAVINVTPDHLDRHGNLENYAKVKQKIFSNQDKSDFAILNYDDKIVRKMSEEVNSQVIFISRNEKPQNAIYLENGVIKSSIKGSEGDIIKREEVFLKGNHNLENAMIAIAISLSYGIPAKKIAQVLKTFTGVEHRLELVETIDGVEYINDSKGTNTDSSIKALESYEKNIIIIAGGYDKKSEFDEFTKLFKGKVKRAILMGETSEKLKNSLKKNGFLDYTIVKNMKETVELAKTISVKGDTVLLSPACASWDMYSSFEERGTDFKNCVRGHN